MRCGVKRREKAQRKQDLVEMEDWQVGEQADAVGTANALNAGLSGYECFYDLELAEHGGRK